MKCSLSGTNLRAFSKAVRLFSKLSNEIFITADNNKMRLQILNENQTAFVEIIFKNRFFNLYECNDETKCKLLMKSLILVFRIPNIEKSVNLCTLIMSETLPKVVFEMKRTNGINREYFLPYMECNPLRSSHQNPTNPSFEVNSKVLLECLNNFPNDAKDITLWLNSREIRFKSYYDEIEDHNITTTFTYDSREFQNYCITNEISVTFNLKDLKYFVEFATFHDQKIQSFFEASGQPIQFIVDSKENYSAKLILATHEFPEDHFPIPPSFPNSNTQNLSLMSSGNFSLNPCVNASSQPYDANTTNNNSRVVYEESVPDSFPSNSVSNNSIANSFPSFSDDPFPEEEDHIIENLLSQMPDFSTETPKETEENVDVLESVSSLSPNSLRRYHKSILISDSDDDNQNPERVKTKDDIVVHESDDEQ